MDKYKRDPRVYGLLIDIKETNWKVFIGVDGITDLPCKCLNIDLG
jgi:hypothetical protein